MKITLNIGLNVNHSEQKNQLENTLKLVNPVYYRVVRGLYYDDDNNLIPERTIVAVVDIDQANIVRWAKNMCDELFQTSIGIKFPDPINEPDPTNGILVYSSDYKGKKEKFNPELFIGITASGQTNV
jgi:hypothetical protein